jgi:outer membrane lipoprotein-sorting protein
MTFKKHGIAGVMALTLVAGCGPKPQREPLPAEVTPETIMEAIHCQSAVLTTFSGGARVRVKEKGKEQTTTIIVAFKRPGRYKITLLGFGGAEIAEIGSDGDSLTVYIPYYNGYIISPKGKNPLGAFLPELADVDLDKLVSVIGGATLPPEPRETYSISLKRREQEAELIFGREGMQYRYRVWGPQLLVAEETATYQGETVWQVERNNFRTQNGVLFPRRIVVQDGRRTLRLDFSGIAVNTELREEDLAVLIPDDAERLTIRNRIP